MHLDDLTHCHRCGRPFLQGCLSDDRYCDDDCWRGARRSHALAEHGMYLGRGDDERASEIEQEWSHDQEFQELAATARLLRDALKAGAA